VDFRVDSLSR